MRNCYFKRRLRFLLLAAVVLLSTGCTAGLPKTGPAVVEVPEEAVDSVGSVGGTLMGEACNLNVLGLVTVGDASVDAAKRKANITTISSIDRKFFGINLYYIAFGEFCTVVRGS